MTNYRYKKRKNIVSKKIDYNNSNNPTENENINNYSLEYFVEKILSIICWILFFCILIEMYFLLLIVKVNTRNLINEIIILLLDEFYYFIKKTIILFFIY